MVTVFWLGLSYLLGAIPFGLLIAKIFCKIDPLTQGSKSTGATNIARTCGLGYGILTLILDILKGFLPIILATSFTHSPLFLTLTGLAVVIGHMYSVFLSWKGGKGVATTVGVFLALAPGAVGWSLVIFLVMIFLSGYVSMGSLTMATVLPILLLLRGDFAFIILSFLLMGLIFWKHRENNQRLRKGEEHSWKKKKA
ncbi:MAG: glycerol-3-phosphate 1-O-acyltransferase PlsY [Desulfoplanes sp.]|nr:glycerol-3-phosphate 1-O-acyltransferase PlsY [Desulfoplanes sp.]